MKAAARVTIEFCFDGVDGLPALQDRLQQVVTKLHRDRVWDSETERVTYSHASVLVGEWPEWPKKVEL